ncbi:MAG: hypothetical protein LBB17_00825 [Puniceicoccales bacterium]|jgi:hypothetical protein|nr:hypothetical protein [Puniceicoccales bacterium]
MPRQTCLLLTSPKTNGYPNPIDEYYSDANFIFTFGLRIRMVPNALIVAVHGKLKFSLAIDFLATTIIIAAR